MTISIVDLPNVFAKKEIFFKNLPQFLFSRFESDFPGHIPYRARCIFAFEEIDDVEVCFFGMHVQEYNDDCPQPNSK